MYDEQYLKIRYSRSKNWKLSLRRMEVLNAFVPMGRLLDYGCGYGSLVNIAAQMGWTAYGYDIIPPWDRPHRGPWDVATFFDSLEHLVDPAETIACLEARYVMISVPWCHYPGTPWFETWKHRRPGEHLWHWSRDGLEAFMKPLGYRSLLASCFEDEYRPRYDPRLPNILTCIFTKTG